MIELTGNTLTIEQLAAIARQHERVASLSFEAQVRMSASHAWVADAIRGQGKVIYGVNTGFGSLANRQISADEARQLSRNLILLCVCGVGDPLPGEIVRAMMTIRANMLAKGHSGVRPVVAQTLIDMLNAGVTPYVPAKGSLGASGDLAPLAHIAAVLTRAVADGAVRDDRRRWRRRWRSRRSRCASIAIEATAGRPGTAASCSPAPRRWRAPGSSGWSWRPRKGWRCRTASTSWPRPAHWPCTMPRACWRTRRSARR